MNIHCPFGRAVSICMFHLPLNETCRLITGCIRPTATPDLYVLSGIAPPEIRRSVHCQNERTKQLTDQRHNLHHHQPVKSRLHSRNSFVSTSQPLLCKPAEARAGLETNARPRRVKFRPGEWFVRPDQPGERVGIFRGFIDHIVIASLALISSGLSRQNEILNRVQLF